ncbi:helix-turn-helix domain-containing protein [Thiovibrio sp. JS02]
MKKKTIFAKNAGCREAQTVLANGYFIVSGEKIRIQPLADKIMPEDFPDHRHAFPTLLELERTYVQKVLAHVDGNRAKAAEMLGINRVSLWRKLKKFAATIPDSQPAQDMPSRTTTLIP